MLAGLVNSFGLARFMTNPMKQIKIINPYTVEVDYIYMTEAGPLAAPPRVRRCRTR
jgi:hypothetical protein